MTTKDASSLGETTGRSDALGVEILIGDTVHVTAWGAPVRLVDVGRRALVVAVNRAGNLVLDGTAFGYGHDPIAGGRGVPAGYVTVARRDGVTGFEGNRAD